MTKFRLADQPVVLGRDPAAAVPLDYPTVSWHHARLRRVPAGIEIEDLGSQNGTLLDGQPLARPTSVLPHQTIAIGPFHCRLLDAAGVFGISSLVGRVTLEAAGVAVTVGDRGRERRLLDPVSFTLHPGELVALMGPSSAGKTTLMNAIAGLRKPSSGTVRYNGLDLYAERHVFRSLIGYVPQDDLLYPQLTVAESLAYTARLRGLAPAEGLAARVHSVLEELNIADVAASIVGSAERKVLSGGQRKRVNIALELLGNPSVLFLDEPTSGLSSFDALQVVELLRRLADRGKTVICTIHQPSAEAFRRFDLAAIVSRDRGDHAGRLVFLGPAFPDAIRFFSADPDPPLAMLRPDAIMSGLERASAQEWEARYQASPQHHAFVAARAGQVSPNAPPIEPEWKRRSPLAQLLVLTARLFSIRTRDLMQTVVLLGQAVLLALLLSATFPDLGHASAAGPTWILLSRNLTSVHFLLVVAAAWFGSSNAARDIVGETALFSRERFAGLSLPAYLGSKLAVLTALALVQCGVLLGIVDLASGLDGRFAVLFGYLVATALVGSALGLLISALAATTEAAIAFLPLVLLPFILLAGAIVPLGEMQAGVRAVAALAPTRWAFEGMLLEEARQRPQFAVVVPPTAGVGKPTGAAQVDAPRRDIAEDAFPVAAGRTSAWRTVHVLLTFFVVLVVGALSVLLLRVPH